MIRTILQKRSKDSSYGYIIIQIFVEQVRVKLSTGIRIDCKYFDPKTEIIKNTHPEWKDLNLILNKKKSRVNDILIKYRLNDEILTPGILKKEFENPVTGKFFIPWMKAEINNRSITSGTKKAHIAIANKLDDFFPGIMFSDLTEDTIEDFNKYMEKKLENNLGTAHNAHKTIATYIRIAIKRKLMINDPYRDKKYRPNKTNPSYLTFAERQLLIDLYESNSLSDSDQKVLRGFLFSCFTGLRLADLTSIGLSNIIGTTLVIMPKKTKHVNAQIVRIPLTTYAQKLIADTSPKKIKIFDCFTEQTIRKKLKKIAKQLNIKKNMKTHLARHTFGTLFWEKTKDVATLQRLLGHSKISQTMEYTHVSDEMIIEQMKIFES